MKASDLQKQNPELHKEVMQAHELSISTIAKHVSQTLERSEVGSVAVHATFLKGLKDNGDMIYMELQTCFIKISEFGTAVILDEVIFYDNEEQYNAARAKMQKESVSKHGNEDFPTWKNYNGKNLI